MIFEKFDGVRGLWNPITRQFYSRWGRDLLIPQYISDTLPQNDWLDGEVLIKYKKYKHIYVVIMSK